jgi:hypothetical protein
MSIKSSMFTAFADIYSSAEANTEGSAAGWRPEAGDHAVLVTGMVADSGEFKQKDGQLFPSNLIHFTYQMIEDPGSPAEPRSFKGKTFNLPSNPAQLTDDGAKTRMRIDIERLKGHLRTVLGTSTNNLAADMEAASKKLAAGVPTPVKLRAKYDASRDGKTLYFTEFLTGQLMG